MFRDLGGTAETVDDGFDIHAIVKPDLTSKVKADLAHATLSRGMLLRMYDEDGNFTDAHRLSIAKRMEQAIRLSRTTKAAVAGHLGVSRAAVTQYCQTGSISLEKLARFCQFTKASMDYIVFGATSDIEASLTPMILEILDKRRAITHLKSKT